MNPAALTPEELAKLVAGAAKAEITLDMIGKDIKEGAPLNGDGTMNIVHYTAWLLAQR